MTRILVAGVGNVFCGDDGFGVAVVEQLRLSELPECVCVVDVGIRGIDLTYALHDGWDATIIIDAMARGGEPGTLYVVEPVLARPAPGDPPAPFQLVGHDLHPEVVLKGAAMAGARLGMTRIVGCEPLQLGEDEVDAMSLSAPVRKAIPEAVRLVESLVASVARLEVTHA